MQDPWSTNKIYLLYHDQIWANFQISYDWIDILNTEHVTIKVNGLVNINLVDYSLFSTYWNLLRQKWKNLI